MRLFTFLSLLFCSFPVFAQEPSKSELSPCGTLPEIGDWLRAYKERPEDFVLSRSSDTLNVGIQIHLLAKDNGTGRFTAERLLNAFCRLNTDFAGANVRFYFKNDWNLINNTAWHTHTEIETGIEMMLTNNVADALNCYFVADPAGNCGYNLPYAGVAMSHGCSGPNDHTWSHEVGHALSLPHTFIGWEGKVYNFQNPTPDTLTYDYTHFHDTIDTQIPAPLDTALVEYLDGSNCAIAADLICDTKPDYLSYRWDCDGQGKSLVQQKDPTGATFYSDGTLFMSYAADNCQNRFSDEQIATLRANLLMEKADWLTNEPPRGDITETAELLSPLGGQFSPSIGTVLKWSSVPNATRYLVQASRFAIFSLKEVDMVTADTTFTIGQLPNNLTYYWRVRPFNDWFACTEWSAAGTFKTADITSVSAPDVEGWRCYPTLLVPSQPITVEIPENWLNQKTQCAVYDATGQMMWKTDLTFSTEANEISLPSAPWSTGAYRLVFINEKRVKTKSFLIIH